MPTVFECTDVELNDLTIVDEANAAIVAGELESARLLLEAVAARAPDPAICDPLLHAPRPSDA